MQLQQYEATYQALAKDPDRWMSSARSLLAASEVLWARLDLGGSTPITPPPDGGHHADIAPRPDTPVEPYLRHAPVYLMLAGFAIENVLKAVRVKQDKAGVTTVRSGALRISDVVRTHDLERLAEQAGVSLSSPERDLLQRLGAFLVWAGRYPVAATARGQAAVQVIWGSDRQAIAALFERLVSICEGGAQQPTGAL